MLPACGSQAIGCEHAAPPVLASAGRVTRRWGGGKPHRSIEPNQGDRAMTTRKLDKRQWSSFFDGVTKMLEGKRAEIEVVSLRLGDQVEAEWLPLLGIAYDSKDDIVEVALDGLDHLIPKPREVYIEDGAQGLLAFEIVDADDIRQIIKLRDPLALPAPARASGSRRT